ncbi:hypothetical protein FHG87_020223 [Trinorchestia longiramus]|nr:hypothetical protein FHG87_020223 [Trinorchestia longiramus]
MTLPSDKLLCGVLRVVTFSNLTLDTNQKLNTGNQSQCQSNSPKRNQLNGKINHTPPNVSSQSERNKLVFDCWKCMVDEKVKMADVNMKKEEEIKRLKAEAVSLRRELEDERKLTGGKDVRSQRKVDGDVNDGVRRVSERDERSRVNEKMNGS